MNFIRAYEYEHSDLHEHSFALPVDRIMFIHNQTCETELSSGEIVWISAQDKERLVDTLFFRARHQCSKEYGYYAIKDIVCAKNTKDKEPMVQMYYMDEDEWLTIEPSVLERLLSHEQADQSNDC